MNLLDGIKINNTIINTKGSEYYDTMYNSNLDLFAKISRFNFDEEIINTFDKAFCENSSLALANLLYILDIRNGKGERRIFKIIYEYLCNNYPNEALRILPFISELGRYDYILIGIGTKIEDETIKLIKEQLEKDLNSNNPSLLSKWLPSHRSHGVNNLLAKRLIKLLKISEKEYRKTLSLLRNKLNIVEKNLTNKTYHYIEFSKVPAKAMLKYNKAFSKNINDEFTNYKKLLSKSEVKINTAGLYSYEIVKKIIFDKEADYELYDYMWKNQKKISYGNDNNILVVADTSASMTCYGYIPYCTSVGLAIYIAQRNKGIFKNHFITFSEKPILQEIKGDTIYDKIHNMREINASNTDIDKVFKLIIDTSIKNNLKQNDLPSHILIISDMEFDRGVSSQNGTNFNGWKNLFESHGYNLPNIIFWNVAGNSKGVPVTKFDNNVSIISGFSTNILNNLFTLDKYSPVEMMLEKLSIYLEMLK